ncbi:MAG: sigma 54-interacting transcriptional regulator [Polyangiaceae bacterium]
MSDTTRSLASDGPADDRGAHLLVVDRGRARVVPLAPRLVLGRDEACDVALDDPTASRRHAIVFGSTPPVLEDAGSRHGTKVGEHTLRKGERRPLRSGDVFVLGHTYVAFRGGRTRAEPSSPAAMVVRDGRMRALLDQVRTFASSRLPILLAGETGTGKELVAEAVHAASDRAAAPLVRLNCAAFPDHLLEAELFGFEKGAFTGALAAKPGLLETADGGTLFLDEIADMPAAAQAKLLRVLESGEVARIGALRPRVIDVRLVSASHKDLQALVASGAFREDLYYRTCGVKLVVPPLRERPDDVLALAEHFLAEHARAQDGASPRMSREAVGALAAHAWPGNVRELRLTVLRAALLARGQREIGPEHLMLTPAAPVATPTRGPSPRDGDERARIVAALDAHGHSQKRAAEALGISRRTLMRRMDALGVARPRKGEPT